MGGDSRSSVYGRRFPVGKGIQILHDRPHMEEGNSQDVGETPNITCSLMLPAN
jgi:hypothetical protein